LENVKGKEEFCALKHLFQDDDNDDGDDDDDNNSENNRTI
jgi:hypothetical protein